MMFPLQPPSVYSPEFDAPEADSFVAYCDTSLSEQILNISVAQIGGDSIAKDPSIIETFRYN